MHQSVRDSFYDFNKQLEGVVPWMYLDIKGLVTVGVGNLLPGESAAISLPFHFDGDPSSLADDDSKRQGWKIVNARKDLAPKGFVPFQYVSNLRLTEADIRTLVDDRLLKNEDSLALAFPAFQSWPADAQLGLLSMAWAMGPGFPAKYPKFSAACLNQDFSTASTECKMQEAGNPGLIPRNNFNEQLFQNAHQVMQGFGYDPMELYFPTILL